MMQVAAGPQSCNGALSGNPLDGLSLITSLEGISLRGGAKRQIEDSAELANRKSSSSLAHHRNTIWTLNTGGFRGYWRLLDSLKDMRVSERPSVVFLQELKCSKQEWKASLATIASLGYRSFCSHNVQEGTGKLGLVTLLACTINGRQVGQLSLDQGSCLAVSVDNILLLNVYLPPREPVRAVACADIECWKQSLSWKGTIVAGGDCNEEPHEGWVTSLFSSEDMSVVPLCNTNATRWQGHRLIDYFLTNLAQHSNAEARALEHRLSDHKVIELQLDLSHQSKRDLVFPKTPTLQLPAWLDEEGWIDLVQQSYDHCQLHGWDEACNLVDQLWHSEDDTTEQSMVDYTWLLCGAMMLSCYKTAFGLSLACLPESFTDEQEIKRVSHLASRIMKKRLLESIPRWRDLPRSGEPQSLQLQKLRNDIGRFEDLFGLWSRSKFNNAFHNLRKKLGRRYRFDNIQDVTGLLEQLRDKHHKLELDLRRARLQGWKHRMRSSLSIRGDWLNKKKTSFCPAVVGLNGMASLSKHDSIDALHGYWDKLHADVAWNDADRRSCAAEIAGFLSEKTSTLMPKSGPQLEHFKESVSRIHGSPGVDQWTASELKVLVSTSMAEHLWKTMELWSETGHTPTVLRSVRCCFVPKEPKVHNHTIEANGLRPITVFSVFWRAYSGAWVLSPMLKDLRRIFPGALGAMVGRGPQSQSAIADYYLQRWHYAASMDYTQCFETLDLGLIEQSLTGLPSDFHRWIKVTLGHWSNTARWVIYDGCCASVAKRYSTGIPQGDAASPLVLGLMLAKGLDLVQQLAPRDKLFASVYMDDRYLAACSKDLLLQAVHTWEAYSEKLHLLENRSKLQVCDLNVNPQDYIEVLGALIGNPSRQNFNKHPKTADRLRRANATARRVSFLPLNIENKLKTLSIFSKSQANYGWVVGVAHDNSVRHFNTNLWKSVGKLALGVPQLRTILAGSQLELRQSTLLSQIRTIAFRDAALDGQLQCRTALDRMVLDQLEELGWFHGSGCWQHQELEHTFIISDLVHDSHWEKAAHSLRQSFRWFAYQELASLDRREFREQSVPPFSESRISLAKRWSQLCPGSFPLAVGAVPSAKLRSILFGEHRVCNLCGMDDPHWDHVWSCALRMDPPADLLLRRFGWPRDEAEMALSVRLLEGVELVHAR